MKNKKTTTAIILIAVLTASVCAQQGGRSFNSADDLKKYLDSQPANGPDKPIMVSMSVNDMMIKNVAVVINNAGKYVSLDLSKSSGLTKIDNMTFRNAKALVNITIPNSVTVIGGSAFQGCTSLTSVIIPNGVTVIGGGAFRGCTSLTSITIPNSIIQILAEAFDGTAWLNKQPDGLVYAGKVAYIYKGAMPANTNLTLLDDTKSISGGAFRGCTSLASVTIPNSVTIIGDAAFAFCDSLTSVTIPNGVEYILDYAFQYCTGLTSITIPSRVIYIGDGAFRGCRNLTSVTFVTGSNIAGFGKEAFPEGRSGEGGYTLSDAYETGKAGTYTRATEGSNWTKQ